MNQRLYGIWLGDVFFSFSGEISEVKVDAWAAAMRRLQTRGGSRPFKQAALRLAELRWPSPVRELSRRPEKKGLSGRSLEGLSLSPSEAWEMLLGLDDAVLEAQGIQPGAELQYWRAIALFALDLISRGKIVPGTRPALTGGSRRRGAVSAVRAVWCPLLEDEADEQRFRLLAAALPPIGLAQLKVTAEEEMLPLEQRQIGVVHSFLTALIDAKIQETAAGLGRELSRFRANYKRGRSPLAELWWNQLTGGTGQTEFQGSSAEVGELTEVVRDIGGEPPSATGIEEEGAGAEIGLCLRLEPPSFVEEESPYWTLTFWAENRDNDLLVPADKIWEIASDKAVLNGREYPDAKKQLLLNLLKAARYSPEVREAMGNSRPEGTELTREEVYRFLVDAVPQLRKAGITVQMPSKWTKEGKRRAGIKLKLEGWDPSSTAGNELGLGMQQLLSFKVEAVLGGRTLSEDELAGLAASKTPLVFFEGEWVEIDTRELRQVLKYIRKHEQGNMTFGELMHLSSASGEAELWEGLNVAGFEMEGLLALLVKGENPHFLEKSPVPKTLQGTLRPYQERGFQWLSLMKRLGFGALLADDMGLGKTIQVITALLERRRLGSPECGTPAQQTGTFLIVCPTSLLGNWQRELSRFAPELSVYIHHGAKRQHGEDFSAACREHDVVLTTYQLVGRDVAEMREQQWAAIVLDEAQYIKNYGTKQAQSVMKLQSPQRIAMTGTPVENRLGELWSIFQFLNPGYLGSSAAFRRQYMQSGEGLSFELEKLRKLVAPFLLRRLKSDPDISKDLPSKIEMKSYCGLTAEQSQLYRKVTDELLVRIDDAAGITRKGLVLSSLTKLKQICDHPSLLADRNGHITEVDRSGKLDRLLELTDTVTENGEAALIFTQYVRMGELLVKQLESRYGFSPYFLHGSIQKKDRDQMVRSFQEGSGPPLFVLSLKAGGVGLNLTRANHVIHYDRWWNPAVENQATDRVFRIGQEKNVEVHKLICQGTLEERIDDLIERKKMLSEQVVGSGENWLTEMSTEELQNLITLQAEEWSL